MKVSKGHLIIYSSNSIIPPANCNQLCSSHPLSVEDGGRWVGVATLCETVFQKTFSTDSPSHGLFRGLLGHRVSLTFQFSHLGKGVFLGWEITPTQSLPSGYTVPVSFGQALLTVPAGPLGQNLGQSHASSHSLVARTGSRETVRHLMFHKP